MYRTTRMQRDLWGQSRHRLLAPAASLGAGLRPALRPLAIAAAFVILGIHLSLAPAHLAESLYIGVLFVLGSVLLGAVMVGLATDSDRTRISAWIGGSLVSATAFVLFLLSRVTGLPGGYHETWVSTPEDLLGVASLAVELVFIGCAAASLARPGSRGGSGAGPHAAAARCDRAPGLRS